MDIIISNSSGQPIYEQICRQIKGAVASGKLKPGEPLPSIRNLARDRGSAFTLHAGSGQRSAHQRHHHQAGL